MPASNTKITDATYDLSVAANGSQRGATVSVSPATVTVPAGQTRTEQGTLSIPASAFAALPSDDTFTVGLGGVVTVRGDIVATPEAEQPASDQTLTIPSLVVPRGLSNVVAGNVSDSVPRPTPPTP